MQKKIIINREIIEYTGAIHNHTEYSKDGRISIKEISETAKKCKLDYLTINDHNNKKILQDHYYKNHKDTPLIIAGIEVNDEEDNHHLLIFNCNDVHTNINAQKIVNEYQQTDAICFAAHPNERRLSKQFRKYEWLDRSLHQFDGIEIWNYSSSWLGKVQPKINGLLCLFFPQLFIRKPLRKNLNFWDQLNMAHPRKSAIGSTDAHDIVKKVGFLKLRVLSFKQLFKSIRTNVLLNTDQTFNECNVLNALKNGNSYVCNYYLGAPWNFYAAISNGKGATAIFGEEIKLSSELKFYFNLPMISDVHLYHNGKKIDHKKDKNGYFKITEKGFYRLEISRFRYGWIYTNPIYVLPYE